MLPPLASACPDSTSCCLLRLQRLVGLLVAPIEHQSIDLLQPGFRAQQCDYCIGLSQWVPVDAQGRLFGRIDVEPLGPDVGRRARELRVPRGRSQDEAVHRLHPLWTGPRAPHLADINQDSRRTEARGTPCTDDELVVSDVTPLTEDLVSPVVELIDPADIPVCQHVVERHGCSVCAAQDDRGRWVAPPTSRYPLAA